MSTWKWSLDLWYLMQTTTLGTSTSTRTFLFPRPKELKCSSNPLSGPLNTHRILSQWSPLFTLSGNLVSHYCETHGHVPHATQNPETWWVSMMILLCSCQGFSLSGNRHMRCHVSLAPRIFEPRFTMVPLSLPRSFKLAPSMYDLSFHETMTCSPSEFQNLRFWYV